MLKKLIAAAVVLVVGITIGAAAFVSAKTSRPAAVGATVHVIEHALTDTVIDTGSHGDTTGDLLTFHNPVFDSHNNEKVGRDQGECTRINPAAGTWECRWVTFLADGQISIEGQFSDTHNTVLAITGGTRQYRDARGVMELTSRKGGTQFDFIFKLEP